MLARAASVEASGHLGQGQARKALKSLGEAGEAARLSNDALLVERIRELRGEVERHASAPAADHLS
jgi:hypothetical protein